MSGRGMLRALSLAVAGTALFGAQGANAANFPVACSGSTGPTATLVSQITAANNAAGADVIDITGGPCTFSLTAVNDAAAGGNGLPIVTSPLTINGNGSTITRVAGSPNFRIFFASSAALSLNQLTVSGGALTG